MTKFPDETILYSNFRLQHNLHNLPLLTTVIIGRVDFPHWPSDQSDVFDVKFDRTKNEILVVSNPDYHEKHHDPWHDRIDGDERDHAITPNDTKKGFAMLCEWMYEQMNE